MSDTLEIFGNEYENVAGFKVKDENGNELTYTKDGGGSNVLIVSLSKNNQTGYWEPDKTWSEVSAAISNNQTIVVCIDGMVAGTEISAESYISIGLLGYVVYETLIDADGEYYTVETWFTFSSNGVTRHDIYTYYDTLYSSTATASDILSGKVAFNGSGKVTGTIATKTSADLTASGATVSVPAGYYESAASKAVSSGSATAPATISGTSATVSTGTNTLTLSKTVSVTPSVSAGYVSSGTAGNSSVSLTASVTTQAAQTIHPSTSDQTISSGRYLTGAQTVKAVALTNLTADNIKSGVTVKVGDSTDDDCVASVTGTYSGGSSKNMQAYIGYASRTANSYGATSVTLTVAKTGTYKISWCAWRSSSSGTMGTNLYIGSTAGTNNQTFTGTYGQCITLTGQSLTKDTVLTLYATSGNNSRTIYVGNLIIEEE